MILSPHALTPVCAGLAVVLFSAPVLRAQDEEPTKYLTWSDLLSSKNMLKFYGFIRFDAQYNDSRFNDPQIPVYVRSEDTSGVPGVPAGVVAEKNDDEYALHARLTRMGVDLVGPDVEGLGSAKLTGKIETDFYNIGLNDSDSRAALRLRRAFVKLGWDRWSMLAGQEWDLISPLNPAVNSDIMMWGAGNTGDRRPQLRAQYDAPLAGGSFMSTFGIGFGGSVSENTVVGGLRSGENSGRPMLAARVGYKTSGGIAFGVWGHDDEEDYDIDGVGPMTEEAYDSNSIGVDLMVPFGEGNTWMKGEYWMGENVDDIRGGIFQGVNSSDEGIDAKGGFVELGHKLTPVVSISVGYSFDDPEDEDLDNFARSENNIAYATAVWNFGDVRIGLEYLNWVTDYIELDDAATGASKAQIKADTTFDLERREQSTLVDPADTRPLTDAERKELAEYLASAQHDAPTPSSRARSTGSPTTRAITAGSRSMRRRSGGSRLMSPWPTSSSETSS